MKKIFMKSKSLFIIIILIKIELILNQTCKENKNLSNKDCFNNILFIKEDNYRSGHFAKNKNGDIVAEYSTENKRFFYGLKKNGSFYYDNELHIKEINLTKIEYDNKAYYYRFESQNIFIALKDDINKTKEYLFSISSFVALIEIYDFEKNSIFLDVPELFYKNPIFSYQFSLLGSNFNNQNAYICIYNYCSFNYSDFNYFYIVKFSFNNKNNNVNIDIDKSIKEITQYSRIITGFLVEENSNIYLSVIYLEEKNKITIKKYDYFTMEYFEMKILVNDSIYKKRKFRKWNI